MTRQIKPVQDNNDKCQTFAYWKSRYKLAMNYGFYVEALVIDYALLEDRLKSFLFHIGVFNTRKSYKADNKKVKPDLYKILTFNHEKNELRVNSIQGKITIVRSVLKWCSETEGAEGKYQCALKTQCESLDIGECLAVLDEIDCWRGYRTEVMHALINKNLESLDENIKLQAEKGMQLANRLDNQIKILKKGNRIRKALNLQNG